MRGWLVPFKSESDPRLGVQIKHILSGNDGDVCNACVTEELLKGYFNAYCIDIGVDEGWWSFFAANCNPLCKIDAFEPNPKSYKALLPYLEGNSQITLHNSAVSDSPGLIPFTAADGESHSRSESNTFVFAVTLDRFVAWKQVHLIKIDTEGHDLKILRSLHPYTDSIMNIIFECSVFWYGNTREECIQTTLNELCFLKNKYKYMYVLSRRGEPYLQLLDNSGDIVKFVHFAYDKRYQVDILVTHAQIKSVPVQNLNV
jgi:FkbM family methyltransferase